MNADSPAPTFFATTPSESSPTEGEVPAPDEAALVRGTVSGDSQAFDTIVHLHSRRVFHFLHRMTRQALLDKVPLDKSQIFRIQGELDPEEAAAKYESDIRRSFRLEGAELPTFDMVQLGMGPDGHTASLFPHTQGLHEIMRIAIANHVPQQKETWRVTLTSPVINRGW